MTQQKADFVTEIFKYDTVGFIGLNLFAYRIYIFFLFLCNYLHTEMQSFFDTFIFIMNSSI